MEEEEIKKYMLSDKEKELKTAIWEEMNKEWIEEQAR